ncbi:nicotinate-nucleotide adenylyltransferase [candidate division KSB3 bacterium]|uniref:Nicotinate-nucleotide adenylyltransferase n=1 Tax=candidate division KSB3 bacterium TaxID=2044937 RepID=A0A2G6E1E7_9BACT|nr:MAG: nicotinate-nucleotide adenylyltransferase [candidate division KSB3 bacterium]PIE28544.1 MAG: nicotinate-nucleotide adenylyltransferase [candidate division KSB3 bacterium]
MNLDKFILMFAGIMVLMSVMLTQWHNHHWVWLTVFISLNLIQASFTGFCPVIALAKRAGLKAGPAFE